MTIINLGIVAHVAAGKTTITEQLLYLSGARRTLGSVDQGTALSDFLDVERERGISVRAASLTITTPDAVVNLIDTPGHVDFVTEVERSLAVLDAAILVVSAVEGVQAHTETLYRALSSTRTPVILFINKVDRVGSDVDGVVAQLRELTGIQPLLMCDVVGQGSRAVRAMRRTWDDADWLTECVDVLSQSDDALLEQYMGGEVIAPSDIDAALCRQLSQCAALPVLVGSAMHGIGMDALLLFITQYVNPTRNIDGDEPVGIIYRITHEKDAGRIAHVRMYGGTLGVRHIIEAAPHDVSTDDTPTRVPQKVTQIRKYHGSRFTVADSVSRGDIAALCGLSYAQVGDIIGNGDNIPRIRTTEPLLRAKVIPAQKGELSNVYAAFQELSAEDPQLDVTFHQQVGEILINITGTIQTEVLTALVKSRFGYDVSFTPPTVIYKETPSSAAYGFEAYTMPKPCWAVLKLLIEPMPRGSGYTYDGGRVPHNKLFYKYQTHIETCVPRALRQGMYNWEVTDLKVTLVDGEHHTIHTHPMDFFLATPLAVMDGLRNAGTTLLEPILLMRITASEEFLGKISGDVIHMRGTFDTPTFHGGNFTMECSVPLATAMDYAVRLASLTSGKGLLSWRYHAHAPIPLELGAAATRIGVNPLDRPKWILHMRGAM